MDSSTINICSCSEPVAILRNKIITTKLATGILTFILYIPIWFYSNRNNLQKYHALRRYFTFQSGSILIERQSWIFQVQLSLYIPIWFYSNQAGYEERAAFILFTFHPCVKYWIHIFFKFPIHFPLLF